MEVKNRYFKLLSLLLEYPDDGFAERLPACKSALDRMPAGRPKTGIAAFIDAVSSGRPVELQESYTAAFDLSPATTLNMTYHIWGDGEKRAGALALLQQAYGKAGYVKTAPELPDYLPLMLEFLAFYPEALQSAPFRDAFGHLDAFVDRLRDKAPAYAALLQPLAAALKGPATVDGQ
jgi:nitrate reductase delta subunit